MVKRIATLLLALSLLLPVISAGQARAASTQESVEAQIARQYDAFVGALQAEGASEGAAQLIKHSIKNGGTLRMGVNDKFTKALLNSQMFRNSFIHAANVANEQLQAKNTQKLFMRGVYGWYEHGMRYGNSVWLDNENGNDADDVQVTPLIRASQDPYTGPVNTYDEAMMLVVGQATDKITFRKTAVTADTITYRATIFIKDRFDFSGADYNGNDTELAETLTWLGRLLSLGFVLNTFDWTVTVELDLTVTNTCAHESGNYWWGFDGNQDLVSSQTGPFRENLLRKQQGTVENGVFQTTGYSMATPVRLYHDRPWVLEIQCAGTGMVFLTGFRDQGENRIYLRKASNTLFFGESAKLDPSDEEKTLNHYGVWFTGIREKPIYSKDSHTYVLTNKVEEDGSNMVWLTIDGLDFGPMNQYYQSGTSMHETRDWLNGRDIVFQSIGDSSHTVNNVSIDHIAVWENGVDAEPFTYLEGETFLPDCEQQGYTKRVCLLCGAEVISNPVPALGHRFGDWQILVAPTCTGEGRQMRSCAVCGKQETESLASTPHTYQSVVVPPTFESQGYTRYTCEACGDSYTDSFVPAIPYEAVIGGTQYATLTETLAAAGEGDTVQLMADVDATGETLILRPGVTLDLGAYDLIADGFIGFNGSYLNATRYSATGDYGKLIVPKENLVLTGGTAVQNGEYDVIPVWNGEDAYILANALINDTDAGYGLKIDEENKTISFAFAHKAGSSANSAFFKDGTGDNALKIIIRLEWASENGIAYQDFVYNDEFVGKVSDGGYNYSFILNNYDILNIDISNLKVTAMIITDAGTITAGQTWTQQNAA